jgi:hypothetical protein
MASKSQTGRLLIPTQQKDSNSINALAGTSGAPTLKMNYRHFNKYRPDILKKKKR